MNGTNSNTDIRTRRLIVTLPNVTGEEADGALGHVLEHLGDTALIGATASHALDDAPLDTASGAHLGVWPYDAIEADEDEQIVTFGTRSRSLVAYDGEPIVGEVFGYLRPDEARKLAALLLRAADDAEAGR